MQQPAHVKSLVATFRGAGYPVAVNRVGGVWELLPSVGIDYPHLIGLSVDDNGSIMFMGVQESELAAEVGDMSDRDLLTLFLEVDVEGWDALFAEAA